MLRWQKKSDGVKALADAKLAKGEKDEAIAKEALKKAMNLSDAEKAEMAQNKNLADQLGKEKMKENLAIGMSLKMKQIKRLKKTIKKGLNKHGEFKKKIKQLVKDKKSANNKFKKCERDKADKLRTARQKYNSSIDKLKGEMQTHLTQSELAKRALQLCEAKERGSMGRQEMRVTRRENRAVKRAKRKMGEKRNEKNVEKVMKTQLEAKIKKKLEKKEAKDVAKKVAKLTGKKTTPKCKACMKLNEEEQKMLAADCKACPGGSA
jgi:hypothetical protein